MYFFNHKDFLSFGKKSIRENFVTWLQQEGITKKVEDVYLIAHPRTFGYAFNPISVFLYRLKGEDRWSAVAEVDNTFGEAKMFPIGTLNEKGVATKVLPKNFYVSPFIPLDTEFKFKVVAKEDSFFISVVSSKDSEVYLYAQMDGKYCL